MAASAAAAKRCMGLSVRGVVPITRSWGLCCAGGKPVAGALDRLPFHPLQPPNLYRLHSEFIHDSAQDVSLGPIGLASTPGASR